MDAETQEGLTVPSSGVTTDEPVIPTNLEHQVKTTEEATAQETVTQVMEEVGSRRPPSIETRTVETQRGNYMTIDMRILEQLGRMEVSTPGLAEPVWLASQPRPVLGPTEVPGMVEVKLVQMTQTTTSQAAGLTGNQEPAGGEPSSAWRTKGEGHDTPDSNSEDAQSGGGRKGRHGKGKLIGKQPAKKGRKGTPKKKTATPAIPLVKKIDQPRLGGLQYQGPCLMAGQRYPSVDKKLTPLRIAKARTFKPDGRNKIVDWTKKQVKECHNARMEGRQVIHRRY